MNFKNMRMNAGSSGMIGGIVFFIVILIVSGLLFKIIVTNSSEVS